MANLDNMKLVEILPPSIKNDAQFQAAATVLDTQLAIVNSKIASVVLLPRIAELPEDVLDALAWQLHVDFYEPVGFSVEKKRALILQSIAWHRHKGTPWAVQQVVSAAFANAEVLEWFDYGGQPGYFKVRTIDTLTDHEAYQNLIRAINTVKNTRSHLEAIQVEREATCNLYAGAVALKGGVQTAKIARPNMTPEGSLLAGFIASLSGVSKISTHMPREAQERKSLGLGVAKGGVRSIQYNPADLPVHERITEVYVGWPTALLVQKAANIQIHPTRPHEAAVGFSFGAVTARHGFVSIRAAPPTKATFGFFAAAAIAQGGIHTIKEVTL